MTETLERLAESVRQASGIRLRPRQLGSLRAALGRAAPGLEPREAAEAVCDPQAGERFLERVIDELTVKETSYLRDPRQLQELDWPALLSRAQRRGAGRLRVWSAACATGEEAYTLAILASAALGSSRPPVSVLGTDISSTALARARGGRYTARALRNLDAETIRRHFEREDGHATVTGPLRELVAFRRHNLARDPGPPAGEEPFDLIVCRNVLIYLDNESVAHAVDALERALHPGGVLLFGAADRLCVPRRTSGARRLLGPSAEVRPGAPRAPAPRVDAVMPGARPGVIDLARAAANEALAADPFSGEAYFVRGTVELAAGDALEAVRSLRSALYLDPTFALAAFQLGRAYDALEDRRAARRAYEQALRSFDPYDTRHGELLGHIDRGDVAAACAARLMTLAAASSERPC